MKFCLASLLSVCQGRRLFALLKMDSFNCESNNLCAFVRGKIVSVVSICFCVIFIKCKKLLQCVNINLKINIKNYVFICMCEVLLGDGVTSPATCAPGVTVTHSRHTSTKPLTHLNSSRERTDVTHIHTPPDSPAPHFIFN